jgi:hypothetical protein
MAETEFERTCRLFREANPWGPLHIVVEDGNLKDHHLDFCEERIAAGDAATADEVELLKRLRAMSEDDRWAVWLKLHPWDSEDA